jgi:hypothetical protein
VAGRTAAEGQSSGNGNFCQVLDVRVCFGGALRCSMAWSSVWRQWSESYSCLAAWQGIMHNASLQCWLLKLTT